MIAMMAVRQKMTRLVWQSRRKEANCSAELPGWYLVFLSPDSDSSSQVK